MLVLFYYQLLALGSKRSQIRKTICIVLIKPFTFDESIQIAIEKQPIVSSLKWVTYRFIWLSSLYYFFYGGATIVMMLIFTIIAKISLPFYFFIFVFCGRVFASSQMNL